MKKDKLDKVSRFLLENQGPKYTSYRCAVHGIFQVPKSKATHSCGYPACTAAVEQIADPEAYIRENS